MPGVDGGQPNIPYRDLPAVLVGAVFRNGKRSTESLQRLIPPDLQVERVLARQACGTTFPAKQSARDQQYGCPVPDLNVLQQHHLPEWRARMAASGRG
jgi:hypothetical protein